MGNEILTNLDGSIASQEQLINGVTRCKILRGPYTVPGGTVGPSTIEWTQHTWQSSGGQTSYYSWSYFPDSTNLDSYMASNAAFNYQGASEYPSSGTGKLGTERNGTLTMAGSPHGSFPTFYYFYADGFRYVFRNDAVVCVAQIFNGDSSSFAHKRITAATLTASNSVAGVRFYTANSLPSIGSSVITDTGTLLGTNASILEAFSSAIENSQPLYVVLNGTERSLTTSSYGNPYRVYSPAPVEIVYWTGSQSKTPTVTEIDYLQFAYTWTFK